MPPHTTTTNFDKTQASRPKRSGMSANLLLIDDEVVTLSITKMMLEQSGYDIQVTQSTSEAISILTRIRIDLILLDISMPNLDGFDFVKLMQSLRLTIPVIFVSGTVDDYTRKLAFAEGAKRCISKKTDFADLPKIIEEVLLEERA